jgi:hypothetical protein
MSPTSYQTAPPRIWIITMLLGGVKPAAFAMDLFAAQVSNMFL